MRGERLRILLLRCFQEIWNDGITAYVFGNILFRVISTHLSAVIDVLLEDVTQNIRVDISARGRHTCIQMPAPFIEELKKRNESLVFYVYVGVFSLNLVKVEHASIKVRDTTIHVLKRSFMLGRIEPIPE